MKEYGHWHDKVKIEDKVRIEDADAILVQIVDAALADTARRSGEWLVCRPGCTQCCTGVFAISQLDAQRLRNGFAALEQPGATEEEQARAERIHTRVTESVGRLAAEFPGNAASGVLFEADSAEEQEDFEARFEDFANDEVCPVLDPATGTCDLYAARPMTCRTFGPPVRDESGGLAVCELCFNGASDEEIAACEMVPDPDGLEGKMDEQLEAATGARGQTLVAFALRE